MTDRRPKAPGREPKPVEPEKLRWPMEIGEPVAVYQAEPSGAVIGASAGGRSLRQLREAIGLTQTELGRVLGFSTRWVAAQEAGDAEPNPVAERRVNEVTRLFEMLRRVVRRESIRQWLLAPNTAFDGLKPIEVIERGQIDRLYRMAFHLESGAAF